MLLEVKAKMPSKKPAVRVLFETEAEHAQFVEQAKENERSASNEFRVRAGLPELKHGGKRTRGKDEKE